MSRQINPFNRLLVNIHDKLGEEDVGKILLLFHNELPEREKEKIKESKQSFSLLATLQNLGIFVENEIECMKDVFRTIRREDIVQIISKYEEEQGARLQHSISASDDRLSATHTALLPACNQSAPASSSLGASNTIPEPVPLPTASGSDLTESSENIVNYPAFISGNGEIADNRYMEASIPLTVLETDGKNPAVVRQAVENSYNEQETLVKQPITALSLDDTGVKSVIDVHYGTADANAPVELRSYQLELIKVALAGRNCIICAPTGSGKTVAVGHAAYTLWKRAQNDGRKFVVCFVVCIRCLVPQQENVLIKMFGQDSSKVGAVRDTESLKGVLQKFDVIVLTGQLLVNALNNKEVSFTDISLLIIDECHHTDLKHPYNRLMTMYMEQRHQPNNPKLPQVVGLTASLGVGDSGEAMDHYIKLCANLNCMSIEHVRDKTNMEVLLQENPPPRTDQIIEVPPRLADDKFLVILCDIMNKVNSHLPRQVQGYPGSQQYENDVVTCRNEAEQQGQHDLALTFKMLKCLNDAIMISHDFRVNYALAYLKENIDIVFVSDQCPKAKLVKQLLQAQEGNLEELSITDVNAKVTAFYQLITRLFKMHNNAKGIVLTRMRRNTDFLADMVKNNPQLNGIIHCERFVGKSPGQMTDEEQDAILKRFRSNLPGSCNLLIATDVAQEGLDLPACSFVIRYNFVSNEIGSVQSKGRARAKNSECYLIIDKGSVNARRERDNLLREHHMLETLDLIDLCDQNELSADIKGKQNELWADHQKSQQRQKLLNLSKTPAQSVTIWCKCGIQLCRASDMRKKGDSLYVCDDETLSEKTFVEKFKSTLKFRYEEDLGALKCSNCKQKLGRHLVFKQGRRSGSAGCRVFINNAVLYEIDGTGTREHIKQWSKVPFSIEEESMID